ncbi:hypothetical protein PFISCL1PPCAC_18441, partial [Pristionchus fissidentatus]
MVDVAMSDEDRERFSSIAEDAAKASREALECAHEMVKRLATMKQREGISLLEVKGRDMLAYVRDMALLMADMSVGDSIQEAEEVSRLVKHRTVLEKVRVLEKKMSTQIDKLTAAARGDKGAAGKKEQLRARPDQMELDSDAADDDDEDEDGEKEDGKVKKYVPPKVMAVHYDEHEDAREEKQKAMWRRKAAQSSLVQELKAQYSEAPEEITEHRNSRRRQQDEERTKYEEEYFVRTKLSKKEASARRREDRENALDSLLKFGDYMAGDEEEMKRREKIALEAGKDGKAGGKKRKGRGGKGGPSAKRSRGGGSGGRGGGG